MTWESFYQPHTFGGPRGSVSRHRPVPPKSGEGAEMRVRLFTINQQQQFEECMHNATLLPSAQMIGGRKQDEPLQKDLFTQFDFSNVRIDAVGTNTEGTPQLLVDFSYERLFIRAIEKPPPSPSRVPGAQPPPAFPGSFLNEY
jgi:hypothetical protein